MIKAADWDSKLPSIEFSRLIALVFKPRSQLFRQIDALPIPKINTIALAGITLPADWFCVEFLMG